MFRAHRCDPVGAKHYELHSFIKRGNSWEAHSAKIAGTEEELAKKASDRERNSLLLEPLRYMEPERRALIDGLLERKNLDRGSHEAQFRCLFVESFSPGQGKDGGQQSEKDERMDVIIAQQIISQAGSAPGELLLPFVSITQGQEQELKQKQPAKLNREEHWLRIYHILFPWDSSSPSPCELFCSCRC